MYSGPDVRSYARATPLAMLGAFVATVRVHGRRDVLQTDTETRRWVEGDAVEHGDVLDRAVTHPGVDRHLGTLVEVLDDDGARRRHCPCGFDRRLQIVVVVNDGQTALSLRVGCFDHDGEFDPVGLGSGSR